MGDRICAQRDRSAAFSRLTGGAVLPTAGIRWPPAPMLPANDAAARLRSEVGRGHGCRLVVTHGIDTWPLAAVSGNRVQVQLRATR